MSRPDPQTDPAGFVLAVCDERERRAGILPAGPWRPSGNSDDQWFLRDDEDLLDVEVYVSNGQSTDFDGTRRAAEHIAAEANPDAVLADVALWRGVVGRHKVLLRNQPGLPDWCDNCDAPSTWPCPDLLAVVTAAQAYVGGAA